MLKRLIGSFGHNCPQEEDVTLLNQLCSQLPPRNDSSCLWSSSVNGAGCSVSARRVAVTKPVPLSYVRQLGNCLKNSFYGAYYYFAHCLGLACSLVQTMLVVLGFKRTLYLK
ncbi:unnamed protein product [Cuscuta campestris]|uniref:Uncharacterized protein n=1 Tax=Cuscuta campestris TaxID=132261 RepID=A0A484MHE5_9ASTE|nr:unnamed protein product [Cuscuta campestris]